MDCEIIMPQALRKRQSRMLAAMLDSAVLAGVSARATDAYTGAAQLVMTWGMGQPLRRPALLQHVRQGGHVVGWDLGYWLRDDHYRMTIDADHPPRVLPAVSPSRFTRQRMQLREDYDKDGPIVLVGLGEKSRTLLGYEGTAWEMNMYRMLRMAYPCAPIVYRPKKPEPFAFCPIVEGTIEDVLRGARLVVCNHSNVAIDACFAGVPAVCKDGAAAALYNSDIHHPFHATREQRLAFLQALAWWQWKTTEAKQAWTFLKQVISDSTSVAGATCLMAGSTSI